MKFSGSNVLITGSSRGIGADIAEVLATYGLKVWINYRSNPKLADELKENGFIIISSLSSITLQILKALAISIPIKNITHP